MPRWPPRSGSKPYARGRRMTPAERFERARPRLLCLLDAVELEDDRNAGLVGASVVLSYDPGLPQPPHIGYFLGEKRLDRLQRHSGLETVIGEDPHGYHLLGLV